MSKGSFQKYQHYLPATYVRMFKVLTDVPKSGKNTVYGFIKIEATKKQQKERVSLLNAKLICGQDFRHTVYVDGEMDNIIEDSFKSLEDLYPHFVRVMREYFFIKGWLNNLSGCNYFVRKHILASFSLLKISKKLDVLSAIYEVEIKEVRNISIFMSRFICYRNKKMDVFFNAQKKPKLKNLSSLIKELLSTNQGIIPQGSPFPRGEWKDFLSLFKDFGLFMIQSEKSKRKEFMDLITVFHRFLVQPFKSYSDDSDCKVYLYAAPKNKPIVSGDFPFYFFNDSRLLTDGCVFTVSPSFALIFSKERVKVNNLSNFSDFISKKNVFSSEKYVYSGDKERLNLFTKHLEPVLNDSYGKRYKK